MTATTMTVHLAEDESGLPGRRVYDVPVAAVQCMPDTAPARTSAHPALFQNESSHFSRSLKKTARATLVAAIAMMTEPTTCPVSYVFV
jgi:hypothetical protein